jgi:hypothetical protein
MLWLGGKREMAIGGSLSFSPTYFPLCFFLSSFSFRLLFILVCELFVVNFWTPIMEKMDHISSCFLLPQTWKWPLSQDVTFFLNFLFVFNIHCFLHPIEKVTPPSFHSLSEEKLVFCIFQGRRKRSEGDYG